jgi:hypothetical protein
LRGIPTSSCTIFDDPGRDERVIVGRLFAKCGVIARVLCNLAQATILAANSVKPECVSYQKALIWIISNDAVLHAIEGEVGLERLDSRFSRLQSDLGGQQ